MSTLTPNQMAFLDALGSSHGNISRAAKACGQARANHHNWMGSSADYREAVSAGHYSFPIAPIESVEPIKAPSGIASVSYRLYAIWNGMKTRCFNPKSNSYRTYGGKGISIYPEWMTFESFAAWAIAAGYRVGLSIDRVDPNWHYEPSNCEWVTREENSRRVNSGYWRSMTIGA